MKKVYYYAASIGTLGIVDTDGEISNIFFADIDKLNGLGQMEEIETPLIKEAERQICEYLNGERKVFSLPLRQEGTAFQMAAWNALLTIPYGETRSYKQMAEQVGNPKACRAIGLANNRNPIAIVIPCHRVIGADGRLVGYGGGLHIKEYLLALERQ